MFITEGNLSSGASETYQDIFSGVWLADYIGSFLNSGGNAVYFFHYLPLADGAGLQQLSGHVWYVHRRRKLSDSAAAGAVFCRTVDQFGVGAACRRRTSGVWLEERRFKMALGTIW